MRGKAADREPGPEELTEAFRPIVEEGLRSSLERDRGFWAGALFPLIGPAIRKAVAAAFRDMVHSLDQVLERTLSVRAARWRWEAFRTGKPLAEIALLHSLVYGVERVLLIHGETGLLLSEVHAAPAPEIDSAAVSGMLTAIQDFVRDSFHSDPEAPLGAMQTGDLTVWIEHGPYASLAAVIRGNAPADLREDLRDALERVHRCSLAALRSFDGDSSPFEGARSDLEDCLQSSYRAEPASHPRFAIAAVALALLAAGVWAGLRIRDGRRWEAYVQALKAQPGIVVTEAGRRSGGYFIAGLRDPDAADPSAILRQSAFRQDKVSGRWRAYLSLEPEVVAARARQVLKPPDTVFLRIRDGVLSAHGAAPHEWIVESRANARAVTGVRSFDTADVIDTGLDAQIASVQKLRVHFDMGSSELSAAQHRELASIESGLRAILEGARACGRSVHVRLRGHADHPGTETQNRILSGRRAAEVKRALVAAGLPEPALTAGGIGSTAEAEEDARSVSLVIALGTESTGAGGRESSTR